MAMHRISNSPGHTADIFTSRGFSVDFGNNKTGFGTAMPYILWYVAKQKYKDKAIYKEDDESHLQTKKMLERLKIKPVRILESTDDFTSGKPYILGCFYKISNIPYDTEKETLFKILPSKRLEKFSGKLLGYIEFYIGAPDAMRSMYLVRETKGEISTVVDRSGDKSPNNLLPPEVDLNTDIEIPDEVIKLTDRNVSMDERVVIGDINGFYVYDKGAKKYKKLEEQEGSEDKTYFKLRYYLTNEDKYPIAGELIAIAVIPMYHRGNKWFYQDTSPFIFSGQWIDTTFYSSGVVKEIIGEGKYKVICKDKEVIAEASDFKEYKVDERVALVIKDNIGSNEQYMTAEKLKKLEELKGEGDYKIVPFSFYEES